MIEKSNGSGCIAFGLTNPFMVFFGCASWPGASIYASPGLDLVPEAAKVYRIICTARTEK